MAERIRGILEHSGAAMAIGRYDEARYLNVSSAFATGAGLTDEYRTIHLGMDLFADAGTPVYAPLAGRVHVAVDNAALHDYGPLIILEHHTDDDRPFYTLYGHLSRESLGKVQVGQAIAQGERLATLGTSEVNGGWTPHLHFQIITDLLDHGPRLPRQWPRQPARGLAQLLARSQPDPGHSQPAISRRPSRTKPRRWRSAVNASAAT